MMIEMLWLMDNDPFDIPGDGVPAMANPFIRGVPMLSPQAESRPEFLKNRVDSIPENLNEL